jgi:hypothetical protein
MGLWIFHVGKQSTEHAELRWCPLVPEIMHGSIPPPVMLENCIASSLKSTTLTTDPLYLSNKSFKSLFQSTFGQYAPAYTVHITKLTIQSNGQCHFFIKHISLSYTVF